MSNYSFSFKLPKETTVDIHSQLNFLPLNLYFHNDEPDPGTIRKTTNKTYEQTYITYFQKEDLYSEQSENDNSVINFFHDSIKGNYNRLNNVLDQIYVRLIKGHQIALHIKGYASPLYNADYNINLSSRRISSLINYINEYKSNIFKQYIYDKKLKFVIIPYGESKSSTNTSADPKNKKLSVYSLDAMLERKIQIVDVIIDDWFNSRKICVQKPIIRPSISCGMVWASSLYLEKAIIIAKNRATKIKNKLLFIKKLLDTNTANMFPAAKVCRLIFQKNEITSAKIVSIINPKKNNLIKGKLFRQELLNIPPTIRNITFIIKGNIRSLFSCISKDPISFSLTKIILVRTGKIVQTRKNNI